MESIDLLYLHNSAEKHIPHIGKKKYYEVLLSAFKFLEKKRDEGKIRFYGMATWSCFRSSPSSKLHVSLERVIELAKEARKEVNEEKAISSLSEHGPHLENGEDHGFRFIQLPINPMLPEAFLHKDWQTVENENMSILRAAHKVFFSFPLFFVCLKNPFLSFNSSM